MKFGKYCPQTSTGLWSGFTEKSTRTENEMREQILKFKPKSLSRVAAFFECFCCFVLSEEFIKEMIENYIDKSCRYNVEDEILNVLVGKIQCNQNCIINCITYVKSGLVKYNKDLLNDVVKLKNEKNS